MVDAVRILKSKNALPAICGRVCPQETQCEAVCTLGKKEAPIAIGRIERYVADWDLGIRTKERPLELPPSTGKKVAVIGSGPAGLTAAADLAKVRAQGHHVRGAAYGGRRADVRHPRVQAAQENRPG